MRGRLWGLSGSSVGAHPIQWRNPISVTGSCRTLPSQCLLDGVILFLGISMPENSLAEMQLYQQNMFSLVYFTLYP